MELLNWLTKHWLDLLQSTGIVGSLWFTSIALRNDAKAKRLQSLFIITQSHREIWSEIYKRPELGRILGPKADVRSLPVTNDERMFVNFLILHLKNVYQASQSDLYIAPEALRKDIGSFFALPVPKDVWDQVKEYQDDEFVAFVEETF